MFSKSKLTNINKSKITLQNPRNIVLQPGCNIFLEVIIIMSLFFISTRGIAVFWALFFLGGMNFFGRLVEGIQVDLALIWKTDRSLRSTGFVQYKALEVCFMFLPGKLCFNIYF